MLQQFINRIKSLFRLAIKRFRKNDLNDSPEQILQQAQEEMNKMHEEHRERAVKAITKKNELEQRVKTLEDRILDLNNKAEQAVSAGVSDIASQYLQERQECEISLEDTKNRLPEAIEVAEVIKTYIRHEENKIRERAAQKLGATGVFPMVRIKNLPKDREK